ncbi:conserved hypothetical protein [Sphingomonas sp. EC-HK361]|uniref:HvfC/BufC N-terminal domain-containing protein n=1 Tax=Sphingomonas sp. EC-HK361 TaxID=2038397 RepID=UPI00125BD1B6|nr:DNA-binding domain-containing protein [Sphingomonas sp. EC-HK361]VVT21861.1 conserved hypothetical protein [Sphingomonas sp. EC-HK361]
MNLAETQRAFGAWLHTGAAPRFGGRARAGLRVYRNTYRAQLAACLEESFPHTLRWIGGEAFHAAIVAHVTHVPPSSWTLDAYARDFPETLGMLYPADPEVAELATIERALGDAFVGADAAPVSAAMLADVDWDRAVLRLTPTLDLVPATTNATAIWRALDAGEIPPPAELLADPATILIWRQDLMSCFRTIDTAEEQAIRRARAGSPFAALCAALVDAHGAEDGVALAGNYLGRWLADGLITDIEGDEPCER